MLPPPTVDPAEVLREAERLLPATGEVIVSVPHNTLLSNLILLAYTAILLQGLFVYNRYSSRRGAQTLESALRIRDDTTRRAAEIQMELDQVRERLLTVEPAEKEYTQEIKSLQFERQTLQRKLSGLATREEELRGKAARAVELDQEIHALEDLLEEAGTDISSKDEEIGRLESSLKKAAKAAPKAGSKSREADQLSKAAADPLSPGRIHRKGGRNPNPAARRDHEAQSGRSHQATGRRSRKRIDSPQGRRAARAPVHLRNGIRGEGADLLLARATAALPTADDWSQEHSKSRPRVPQPPSEVDSGIILR